MNRKLLIFSVSAIFAFGLSLVGCSGKKNNTNSSVSSGNISSTTSISSVVSTSTENHVHTFESTYSSNTTHHWYASTCGHASEMKDYNEHSFGSWNTTIEPTEDTLGKKERTCSECGYVDKQDVEKLPHTHKYESTYSTSATHHWYASTCGHDSEKKDYNEHTFGSWNTTIEPTEDTLGKKERTCSECGYLDEQDVEKLPHTHKYASTYSTSSTHHWYASTCGHTSEMKDYNEHSFGSWNTTIEPTEDTLGKKERTCSECGYLDEQDVEKLPHTHKYESTYSSNTTHHWYASTCGHTSEKKDYNEHSFGSWNTLVEPTEDTLGKKQRTCSECGYLDEQDVEKLPHTHKYESTYSSNTTKHWYASTCGHDTISGEEEHTSPFSCSKCGYVASESEGLAYTLSSSGEYYIVSGIGTCTDIVIVIPMTYEGKPVKEIKDSAFYNTNIQAVKFTDNITSIGLGSFMFCKKIKSVVIPKNVSSIGSSAFMGCTSLESIVVDEQNTTYDSRNNCNAVISSTNQLVLGCKNTIIPDGVTEIGGYSFRSCEGLTTLAIPESVESIGNNAFYGCTGLTSIEIPKNVSSIGTGNFQYCANLSRIVVDELNETYDSRNNCNAIINSDTNELVFGCKTTIIPSSVTSIGGGAFRECKGLTTIVIPEGVTSIENSAFGYSGLTSVTISGTVTSIGAYAFTTCYYLTELNYLGTVEEWNSVEKGSNWKSSSSNLTTVNCSDGTVTL